jgi:hypothetical protein
LSLSRLWSNLSRNRAHTHPRHEDPSLRGRTYVIPFAKVWDEATAMASGGLRGWTLLEAAEDLGVFRAEAKTLIFGFVDDVEFRISLDENAQTRVDMTSESRKGKGDLGMNARRIRKFFRILDKRVGAGPGMILDPTVPLIKTGLLLFFLLFGCAPGEEFPPGEGVQGEDASQANRNFQGRSYERHIVFLTAQGDSTLLVPWSFSTRTKPGGVDRSIRGWLARSNSWDPFVEEVWESPPTRVPWRILPRGPARIIVGSGDAVERIFFEEGPRRLEVILGDLLVEWTGQRAQTFRVHEGSTLLSSGQVPGFVLDMTRAWTAEDPSPGDWGFLISGDSLQVVLENQIGSEGASGGSYSGWGRVGFVDQQWEGLQLIWSEIRAFEPARRDIPMSWQIQSGSSEIEGFLEAVSPFLEVGEGEGPMLPVDALYQVSGTLTLEGREFPVRGLIRHQQH